MSDQIAFIGGGNMAYALAIGLLRTESPPNVIVADPIASQRDRFTNSEINTTSNNKRAVSGADVIVLAVKPKIVRSVALEIAPLITDQLVLSIAAGIPLHALNAWFGETASIVRCMPNTPALIGAGISGLVRNMRTSDIQAELAHRILGCAGEVLWFEEEADLDAVTAISGSGPAYIFYLIEAMIRAAIELGLTPETARKLTLNTVLGGAKMAINSDDDPETLRRNVTSPGGTTERAVAVFDHESMNETIVRAITEAHKRSIELSHEADNDV
ncbi:MAG: pyrroline-5-carboxylate reductase [Gammaproteobacteria bacterium]|nr:pyrroline-5-carboxylate reductase [Gammaproteobacteria bacterium]HCP50013.1 pyrroline-5-carboxylate reductase [Gammaproteobacteria bacterium]|tara:strand:- start:5148 stop:5963 length:816 start_codon:yes stop_codon:yes gene_type:complete